MTYINAINANKSTLVIRLIMIICESPIYNYRIKYEIPLYLHTHTQSNTKHEAKGDSILWQLSFGSLGPHSPNYNYVHVMEIIEYWELQRGAK